MERLLLLVRVSKIVVMDKIASKEGKEFVGGREPTLVALALCLRWLSTLVSPPPYGIINVEIPIKLLSGSVITRTSYFTKYFMLNIYIDMEYF